MDLTVNDLLNLNITVVNKIDRDVYNRSYYDIHKDKWKNFYNNKQKLRCAVCDKEYRWIDRHFKTNTHKNNMKLQQKDELLKSIIINNV